MSNIDKKALREAAEKATKGEWWSDVVETDGEYGEGEDRVSGYHSYAVYVGHESLLDMTNSTAACIHTEWDHDYRMAWDETAKCNAEFIAAANPAIVLALLDELEAKDKAWSAQDDHINQQADRIESLEKKNGELGRALGTAEKRIAELEAREVNGRFPLPKDSSQGWKIDPEFISKIQDAIGYDEECQCWEGSPSMEMVEAVLIAAAAIKMDERG
ncbi:ead/Ea22-like family protein [Enterobacter hormaechei]